MAPELEELGKLFWEEDQTWSFPVLQIEENCDKNLDIMNFNVETAEKVEEKVDDREKPPPPAPKGKKRSAAAGKGVAEADHEAHIWTERERRKRMRNMFANLHSLLPNLPPKADKSSIVDEAIQYIKKCEQNLESLQKQKQERVHGITSHSLINFNLPTQQKLGMPSREAFLADMGSKSSTPVSLPNPNMLFSGQELPTSFMTWSSPNVVVNVTGTEAHFSICGPKKPRLLTAICCVMEKYKLEVVSAQISGDRNRCMYMIHTKHATGASGVFPMAAFSMEEIFKQAATEIMWWISS